MATLTFGSYWFSTEIATVSDPGVPTKVNGLTTALLLEGFAHIDNRLTNIGVGRTYDVQFSGTIALSAGASDDSVVILGLRKNGAATPGGWVGRNLDVAKVAEWGAIGCGTQVYLDTSDYIELWLSSSTGEPITINGGTLTAKVIG